MTQKIAIVGLGHYAKKFILETMNSGDQRLEFVVGFDIAENKVEKNIYQILDIKPCSWVKATAKIFPCDVYDSVEVHKDRYNEDKTFKVHPNIKDYGSGCSFSLGQYEIVQKLKETKANIVINYIPYGSVTANGKWSSICLEADCHLINFNPSYSYGFLADRIKESFKNKNLNYIESILRGNFHSSKLLKLFYA